MKREESLELIRFLLARRDAIGHAHKAFSTKFPEAPKEMVHAATFHVCVDGIDAALDWLASIERFLQNPHTGICSGATWHLLHHVYSWQQIEALMPLGKSGIIGQLSDIKKYLEESETEAAKEAIDDLLKCLTGDVELPRSEDERG